MGIPIRETSGIWFGETFFLFQEVSWAMQEVMIKKWILVGAALPVLNRFITPIKWPYKWVTGVVTLLIEVVTPLTTGTGPTCNTVDGRNPAPVEW